MNPIEGSELMPANAAHYLFAKMMIPKLKEIDSLLDTRSLYYGAQGPDIFFFHRVLPWMPGKSLHTVGSHIHHMSPAIIFQTFADYWENQSHSAITRSYIYGFILHFALDRRAHLFINAEVNEIMKKEGIRYSESIIHNRIETNLDTILIRDFLNIDGNQFQPWKNLTNDSNTLIEISNLLIYFFKNALHLEVTQAQMIHALKDTSRILRLLTDKNGIKTKFFGIAEKLLPNQTPAVTTLIRQKNPDTKWDYANFKHTPISYEYMNNSLQTDSFYDIIKKSEYDAQEIINNFLMALSDHRPMTSVVGNRNFCSQIL